MSLNNKNIIDLKVVQNTEKYPNFSTGLYHWMMFLINFYNRVKKDLKIDFDSFMILQLVVSDYLYKTNKEGTKNYKELEESFKNYPDLFKDKRKVNIASIAEVLNLPRETVRRKVLYLQKVKLLNYDKSGINVGPEYKIVFNQFVSGTVSNMSILIKKWDADGSLKNLLEFKKN